LQYVHEYSEVKWFSLYVGCKHETTKK